VERGRERSESATRRDVEVRAGEVGIERQDEWTHVFELVPDGLIKCFQIRRLEETRVKRCEERFRREVEAESNSLLHRVRRKSGSRVKNDGVRLSNPVFDDLRQGGRFGREGEERSRRVWVEGVERGEVVCDVRGREEDENDVEESRRMRGEP
jgi:hypothetical protein